MTGLAWDSAETLVSVSKDVHLRVQDLLGGSDLVTAPSRILNPCTSAWAPGGDLAFALGREALSPPQDPLTRGRRRSLSLLTGWDDKVTHPLGFFLFL